MRRLAVLVLMLGCLLGFSGVSQSANSTDNFNDVYLYMDDDGGGNSLGVILWSCGWYGDGVLCYFWNSNTREGFWFPHAP